MARGKPPFEHESSVDKFLRSERERQKQIESITRPFGDILDSGGIRLAAKNALSAHSLSYRTEPDTFRAIHEATKRHQALSQTMREVITPTSVLAMRRTALAVSDHLRDFDRQMRGIAQGLAPALSSASRALETNSKALAAVFASKAWQDQISSLSRIAETLQPTMAALARSTEVFRILDAATPRASVEAASDSGDRLRVYTEEAHRAEEALTRLAGTDDETEAVGQLTAFMRALSALFHRLGKNTAREIVEMGLVGWLVIAITLLEALPTDNLAELPPEDRAQLEDVSRELASLRNQLSIFDQFASEADEQFVANLPRAEVRVAANVRIQPKGSSQRFHRLESGTPVAIAGRQARWRLIVFRDMLTDRLSSGWVYYSSLSEETPAIPDGTDPTTQGLNNAVDSAGETGLSEFSRAAAARVLGRSEW